MVCDEVHNGLGYVQAGPYHCYNCGASEIGRERFRSDFSASDEEIASGFYRNSISPIANTFLGELVDHKAAKALYRAGMLDMSTNNEHCFCHTQDEDLRLWIDQTSGAGEPYWFIKLRGDWGADVYNILVEKGLTDTSWYPLLEKAREVTQDKLLRLA